eukprot:s1468_g16.t1
MAEEDGEEPPAPRNKAEFYKLFNQKGPTNMICGFMLDKSLKLMAHILVDISYPLENSYYCTLDKISEGWTAQEEFISGRSAGEWLVTVHEIMKVLELDAFHNHLEFSQCMRFESPPSPDNWPAWALGEEQVLDQAYCFGVALAENVLWSNIHHWLEFPSVVATVLHHDPAIVEMSLIHMTKLARAVNGAEKVDSATMKQLLDDLGWNREQLARESMALTLQLEIEELKRLARRLFRGTPSTKDCLENTFAFLHRKAQIHSTNNKMSDMAKYLYTIMSPYAKTGGCPQILPSKRDLQTDYLVLCAPVEMSQPLARDLSWLISHELDGSWRFVPVKRLIRGLLPQSLFVAGRRFCWEITSTEYESLIYSAVREGTWIALANLRQICNSLGIDPPRTGSGKNNSVLKADWARKLVEFLFPGATQEEMKRMISALTWKSNKMGGLKDKERSVLEMVSELDQENREAPEFQKMIKLAQSRLKEMEKKEIVSKTRKMVLEERERADKAKADAEAAAAAAARERESQAKEEEQPSASSGSRRPSQTPANLRDFLLPEMLAEKIALNRDPNAYGYRAYYPSFLFTKQRHFQLFDG